MSIWLKRRKIRSKEVNIKETSNNTKSSNYRFNEKEFWSLVDVKGENDCWSWKGSYNSGYGYFHRRYAHKVSYILKNGKFPKDQKRFEICHKCNNPRCVNPNHLYVGSHAENMKDTRVTNTLNDDNLKGKTNKLISKWRNKIKGDTNERR